MRRDANVNFAFFFLPLSLKTECFDLSARCCQCKWFFGLIFSSECETVMHYIIIIIIILPIYNSIFMLRKKQRNSTMESRRKREKNSLKYETHFMFPELDRYLRFSIRNSSFPFRRTFKWHWLLVRIVTHSAFGERIYRAGTHSFCPARIQFEMEFSVVPLFAHGFSEFAKSNGDTKSMLICHRFFLLFFSFRRLAITSTQFVNCPFTLTLDRWSEQKHRNIRTTVTIQYLHLHPLMCKNMLRCFFFVARNAEGSNKFSADEKSQIPIEININSNWKINIHSALAGLHAVALGVASIFYE